MAEINIKEIIEEMVKKITADEALKAQFEKHPYAPVAPERNSDQSE